jgi:TetR/AcrR family transcriptional repressor of lmrAB and yxaGH operons
LPSDSRRKMIESAVTLLALHGLAGTAFRGVVERSGAPRGSIYHHFPNGKDQLLEAAIEVGGATARGARHNLDRHRRR